MHEQTGHLNNDFRTCLHQLMEHGTEAHPRGTATKEILNYNITLQRARNRVITFPERNTNTKYLLGEFIWYVNGSSLPDGILPYSKFWANITNSGDEPGYREGTINSNYGNRLFGFTQLPALQSFHDMRMDDSKPINQWQETINLLERDKDSRQAIMNIHLPSDRHEGNKDVPCLAGDTVLLSPEGNVTIKQLADRFDGGEISSYPIYSWNEDTQITSIQQCTKAWKTGTKKARRITFSDGTTTTGTHDHIVWQRKMVYDHGHVYHIERPQVKIGDMKVGDVLCGVPTFTTGEGRMTSSAKKTITKIEELDEIDVYDFTEPINHNCVLDNGLIVHNCTLTLHWFIRENRLCLIVNMRSNDVILGFTNDVFQFTMLQEALMVNLKDTYPDIELGCYFHNAGSMHIYDRHFEMADKIIANDKAFDLEMIPMDRFDKDIALSLGMIQAEWINADLVEDFDFSQTANWSDVTLYWQTLIKAFFNKDDAALHILFGHAHE